MIQSVAGRAGELGLHPDSELEKVLEIAAHIGVESRDAVNVSYTSLFIGLLWGDDPTSRWLRTERESRTIPLEEIYRHRGIGGERREPILKKIETGEPAEEREDWASVSASTVLREAIAIARETGLPPGDPVGTRHVLAAYFFRNPPGHDRELFEDWGFGREEWRRAFAQYIASLGEGEARAWSQVLAGYLAAEEPDRTLPGQVLGSYVFDDDTIRILRALERSIASRTKPQFGSENLLETLVSARDVPDCASFAELVAERLGIKGSLSLAPAESNFGAEGSSYGATRGFKNILDRARTLTVSITGTERIGARHIVASLLVAPDSMANRRLVNSGVSLPAARLKLFKEFTRRWVNDDGGQWRFHLIGATPPTIAGYNSDEADKGDDKLDVTRYATAFAVVMAAEKVYPPLSIGIFGDWGSGKSFFMRLMSEQTDRVCASTATTADGERLFCRRVVPIRFNAWHYAEQDLWASLVQTIFQALRAAMVGSNGESDLMDEVIARLELAKVARKEAEDNVAYARERRKNSEEKLESARSVAAEKASKVQEVATRDVIAIARAAVLPDARLREAAAVAERYLGVEGAQKLAAEERKNVGEVMDFVAGARSTAARVGSAWGWLARAPVSRSDIGWLVAVSVVLLAGGALLAVKYRNEIGGAWPTIYSTMLEMGALLAMATRWAKRHLGTVSRGLDQFESIQRQIDAKLAEEQAAFQKEVTEARTQRDAAVAAQEQAEAELKATEETVRQAEQELSESRSAQRIARLVEQRLTGRNYEQYLGIVAAIRADFQTLTDLMKRRRKERDAGDGSVQPIDRIVLYIDDLDRCPADKVVMVLEAIHLLLAFELFVVVVGVDIRWAARSLAEKYPRHLTAGVYESGERTPAPAWEIDGASALDYLEKIFQIPFWLPPMDEEASRAMIAALAPAVRREERKEEPQPEAKERRKAAGREPDQAAAAEPARTSLPRLETAKAQSLVIDAEERNYMLGLAGAVGKSPRRLKRFVNTYRILKASLDALSLETFVVDGGKQGEYRAAMTLLALVTGAPRSSLGLLKFLGERADGDPFDLLEQHMNEHADPGEKQYVDAALASYRTAAGSGPLALRPLRDWAPQVARFSFRSGRT